MSSGRDDDGDLVMLEDPIKLRKLASLLLNQEEALNESITTEDERNKYLDNCNASYDGMIKLLNDRDDLTQKYKDSTTSEDVKKIVETIHHYITYCLNMSMQCIRNCTLRVTCVNKIQEHFVDLSKAVEELQPDDLAAAGRLAEEVTAYKNFMWEYTTSCRSATSRAVSEAYSLVISQEGITFQELVDRHKNKLELEGDFADLDEFDKFRVYKSITEESGRVSLPLMDVASASLGIAVLVATAALIAFDIFESGFKLEAIVRNAFNVAADVGSFAVQLAVDSAMVAEAEFEGAAILVVAGASFLAGILAAVLFTAASGYIIDMIFGSGGKIELQTDELQFHKLEVPDGMAIAYEISHDDD
ncbi:hypothetical protein RND81_10G032600 [Saponaria officinalis]|uniref:Uncharacterized protein n=1 Tax=Saponaria officinalis TaxID=3572 RepID=A0AAW1HXG7_SAPOF